MKTYFKTFVAVLVVAVLSGCAATAGLDGKRTTGVSDWQTSTQAVARGANAALPELNDINTCPDGMTRYKHKAGGSAASDVRVTEEGTIFTTTAEGGQSHKCRY